MFPLVKQQPVPDPPKSIKFVQGPASQAPFGLGKTNMFTGTVFHPTGFVDSLPSCFRCACSAALLATATAAAAARSAFFAAAATAAAAFSILRCAAAASALLLFLASSARRAARARTAAITASLFTWHPDEVLTVPVLEAVTLLESDSSGRKKRRWTSRHGSVTFTSPSAAYGTLMATVLSLNATVDRKHARSSESALDAVGGTFG